MITDEDIARINFLAKKLKTEGLTADKIEEQKILRRAFIDNIKSQVKQQLDSIEYVDEMNASKKCSCGCGEEHHHEQAGHHHHEHAENHDEHAKQHIKHHEHDGHHSEHDEHHHDEKHVNCSCGKNHHNEKH